MEPPFGIILAVLFAATLVRAILGFGEALIAVPLLSLWMPVEQAAPVAVLVSITIAAVLLLWEWRQIQVRATLSLTGATLLGIPAGVYLLTALPEAICKALLGVAVAAFALRALIGSRRSLADDRWAGAFGLGAGVLGGAYGMNGPPLALYGALRGWSAPEFRATLQAYFLPASIAGMAGYWAVGLWTPAVSQLYIQTLPGVLVAIISGRLLQRHVPAKRFTSIVYGALLVIGGILVIQAAIARA